MFLNLCAIFGFLEKSAVSAPLTFPKQDDDRRHPSASGVHGNRGRVVGDDSEHCSSRLQPCLFDGLSAATTHRHSKFAYGWCGRNQWLHCVAQYAKAGFVGNFHV